MKRIILLLLAGLGLRGPALAQGFGFNGPPALSLNLEAVSNSPGTNQPSGHADYYGIRMWWGGLVPTNTLFIYVDLGPIQATNGCILEIGNDGLLTPILRLNVQFRPGVTNNFPFSSSPPVYRPPNYYFSQSFQPTIVEMDSLMTGKLYVEADYENGKYLGNLLLSSAILPPEPNVAVSSLSKFSDTGDLVMIAPDNRTAKVVLDGSASVDPYYLPLQFAWLDGTNFLVATSIATNVLVVGTHQISMTVNDGFSSNSSAVTLDVITPGEAVDYVAAAVGGLNFKHGKSQVLRRILVTAAAFFDRGNMAAGVHQLRIFQNRLRFQAAGVDLADGVVMNDAIQQIIDAVNGVP